MEVARLFLLYGLGMRLEQRENGEKRMEGLPSKLGRKVESGLKARSGSVTARKTR